MVGGFAALGVYAHVGSAVSHTANAASKAACAVWQSAVSSEALYGTQVTALSDLRALALECAEANWDGYGAAAIDELAVRNAEDVLFALPPGIPMPDLAPEPNGGVSLEWFRSRNQMFSISVNRGLRLAYAWLDGSDRGHAVARFDQRVIPAGILEGIKRIILDDSGVRAA